MSIDEELASYDELITAWIGKFVRVQCEILAGKEIKVSPPREGQVVRIYPSRKIAIVRLSPDPCLCAPIYGLQSR